jgi:hypothetical protein
LKAYLEVGCCCGTEGLLKEKAPGKTNKKTAENSKPGLLLL